MRGLNGTSLMPGPPPLVAAASALVQSGTDAYKEQWPYAWEYPPVNAEQINVETSVSAPANATTTLLVEFDVPDGFRFRLKGLMLAIVGNAYADGSGQYTWILDVNIPVAIGAIPAPILPSGYAVPYWNAITIHKGSPDLGPWPIPGRLVFEPRDQVRVKVTTQAPFPSSSANVRFLTSLVGWTWPL